MADESIASIALATSGPVRAAWREAKLAPLWESKTAHKSADAAGRCHQWRWREVRPLLDAAMSLMSPSVIERRVLSLVNPISRISDDEMTTGNLAAALQAILPSEHARPHRHSMNAVRFVLEGEGAETIVNGKRCAMEFGDLILTPAWCWHEHRHMGSNPVIWLDVLDVPLHAHLNTMAFEPGPVISMPPTIPDFAFGTANFIPEFQHSMVGEHSPVFRYPYELVSAALSSAPRGPDGARRVRYSNPMTGGAAIPFLDCSIVQLDPGLETRPFETNASSICCIVEGTGTTELPGQSISWSPRDLLTLPPGQPIRHRSELGARLLVVSDREVFSRLGLLKERFYPEASVEGRTL